MSGLMTPENIQKYGNAQLVGLSSLERLVMCNTNNAVLERLLKVAEKWNTEDSRYICLNWNNAVYFSNDIDCDGARYWSRKGFAKFIAKQGA